MMSFADDNFSDQPVFSVSELARRARIHIEEEFSFVQVEGEISNFRRPGSGHWYFTLKDDSAQLRCAMFAGRNRLVRLKPSDGQQVLIRGRVSLYEARGDFQIIADQMTAAGEGALRAAFEALQHKLSGEGLFDAERKLPLPALPAHLTIISSASGAALRDVLHVIERRYPALSITLIPTLVQGEGAEAGLLRALAIASDSETDVVLLTRGGGSLEDLWSFNLETVARAVADCPHPVVSAIGHQTDFTICDFVADVRAPTPSAGAELITPAGEDLLAYLAAQITRLRQAMRHEQRFLAQQLAHTRTRLIDPRQQLSQQMQQADDLERRLQQAFSHALSLRREKLSSSINALLLLQPARTLPGMRERIQRTFQALNASMNSRLNSISLTLSAKARALDAVSPLNTLHRGYAVLTDASSDGGVRTITSVTSTERGRQVLAYLEDGALELEVQNTLPGAGLGSPPE
jgi:exodeoxyribonuclease VII large subunit